LRFWLLIQNRRFESTASNGAIWALKERTPLIATKRLIQQ
jgi:hypothetical protein